MTPTYLNHLSSFHPVEEEEKEEEEEEEEHQDQSSSSLMSSSFLSTQHHQQIQKQEQQEPSDEFMSFGGSSNNIQLESFPKKMAERRSSSSNDPLRGNTWMSSKMRLMRKMLGSDQVIISKPRRSRTNQEQQQPHMNQEDSNSNNKDHSSSTGIIRVCSDCNTTKTPLWRSGPRGPKSLCNACGIRQRKARRAMAAAVVSAGLIGGDAPITKRQMEKKTDHGNPVLPFKKRCKMISSSPTPANQISADDDDTPIKLSKNSAFRRVFPQDEKDAAVLLMALSCGLIHS